MSWREVEKRWMLSRSLRVWAEHMPKAECPECKGNFASIERPVEKPPEPPAEQPKKRKYTKRKSSYWAGKE